MQKNNQKDKHAVVVKSAKTGDILGYIAKEFNEALRSLILLAENNSRTLTCTVDNLGDSYCFYILIKLSHMSSSDFNFTIACLKGTSEVVNEKKRKAGVNIASH